MLCHRGGQRLFSFWRQLSRCLNNSWASRAFFLAFRIQCVEMSGLASFIAVFNFIAELSSVRIDANRDTLPVVLRALQEGIHACDFVVGTKT